MKCPADGNVLLLSERQGIEIDYCPECRGVWLDRGELDKIISRSAEEIGGDARPSHDRDRSDRRDEKGWRDDDDDDDDRGRGRGRPRKKSRSFLEDLFEFGG